jgi:hypothetical protein
MHSALGTASAEKEAENSEGRRDKRKDRAFFHLRD